MNRLTQMYVELRDRHLLWLGGLLIAAIIVVPVALLKSATSTAEPPPAPVSSSIPGAARLPVVTLHSAVVSTALDTHPHDPFDQGPQWKTTPSTVSAKPAKTASGSTSSKHGTSAGSSASSTTSGGSTTSSTPSTAGNTTTTTTTTTTTSAAPPVELADNQAYSLTLGITRGSGLNTVDGVERLSGVPSSRQPLLLSLGVLNGGKRFLFAVLPGTVVSGPGQCLPGGVDCEIIELAPGQIESVAETTGLGPVNVAQFAVTAVHVLNYSSVAGAQLARRRVSALGERLVHEADLPAIGFFPFNPGLGALVDLRTLNHGGT